MSGTVNGPVLPPDAAPWPVGWEQDPRIDDGHEHEWELVVLLGDGERRVRHELVVRCAVCLAPRCGSSSDADPCMERRHHGGLHFTESGQVGPVGGTLR